MSDDPHYQPSPGFTDEERAKDKHARRNRGFGLSVKFNFGALLDHHRRVSELEQALFPGIDSSALAAMSLSQLAAIHNASLRFELSVSKYAPPWLSVPTEDVWIVWLDAMLEPEEQRRLLIQYLIEIERKRELLRGRVFNATIGDVTID